MSAISALRKLDEQQQAPASGGLHAMMMQRMKQAGEWATWFKKQLFKLAHKGGRLTWIIATTMLFTVIPLGIEIMREADVKEMEALRVQSLKAQGFSAIQIANMGYQDPNAPSLSEALQ
ncbi:hypothetical protein THRCLA_23313 [Thraustotheca clavata]|uniref:Mitochondrial import receptor subunit TOM22 n=1 Tax=Thraustotheca clavata TaxID=74557 RepID=A0A1V9Y7N8_9STRA|nr:hypothetical protein THRCLA_23313 [Thraustotheca clavata]